MEDYPYDGRWPEREDGMDLEDVLYLRRTTRKYQPQQIQEDALQRLLEAAQAAPLAMGDDQSTHLTVVQDPGLLQQIRDAVQTVSRKTGLPLDPLHGAPTLILVSATDLSEDHIELCNAACVIENMSLQATALNLGSSYIWGCLRILRQHKELLAMLQIPEGYEILSGFVVGYPVNPLQRREKQGKMSVNRV